MSDLRGVFIIILKADLHAHCTVAKTVLKCNRAKSYHCFEVILRSCYA